MAKQPLSMEELMSQPKFKNSPDLKRLLPKPEQVRVSAPQVNDSIEIDPVILRRTKVKELRRMGYSDPDQISMILDKGIMTGGKTIYVDSDAKTIKEDLLFIVHEEIASDRSAIEKRHDLIDKLYYLYQRAFTDYTNAKGPSKNTFLNSAFSILKTIIDMEGVSSPNVGVEGHSDSTEAEAAVSDINKLTDDQRSKLASTIKQILKPSEE